MAPTRAGLQARSRSGRLTVLGLGVCGVMLFQVPLSGCLSFVSPKSPGHLATRQLKEQQSFLSLLGFALSGASAPALAQDAPAAGAAASPPLLAAPSLDGLPSFLQPPPAQELPYISLWKSLQENDPEMTDAARKGAKVVQGNYITLMDNQEEMGPPMVALGVIGLSAAFLSLIIPKDGKIDIEAARARGIPEWREKINEKMEEKSKEFLETQKKKKGLVGQRNVL
eukprot:CAMPEP_0115098440 /NCGR_PEP_ID=MMETSP0227-20121206/31165_1 /TAXON_ID=89957 /ORGANISM="Polarella glacialis, Strain CCMP 1383" /LENGTH=225 /DNA_ID=CAMNT_0002493055 /DNA_START=75 /DNA_END=752 /DNA_ORIENTATION=+